MLQRISLWTLLASEVLAGSLLGSGGITYQASQRNGSSDISFSISGPTTGLRYAAIGLGSQMIGSLM